MILRIARGEITIRETKRVARRSNCWLSLYQMVKPTTYVASLMVVRWRRVRRCS